MRPSASLLSQQVAQRPEGRLIADAIDSLRSEMTLEGGHHIVRDGIIGPVRGHAVTVFAEQIPATP